MTDIAKLGFDVGTEDLLAATKQLDKLSTAAAKAEVEAKKLEKTNTSASLAAARSADTLAGAAYRAAAGNKEMSATDRAVLADTAKKASAAVKAAQALDQQASAALQAARANMQLAESAEAAIVDLLKLARDGDTVAASALENAAAHDAAAASIIQSYRSASAQTKLTAGQMQANFTNMAAQFQDIGVTAAMGMNPLLIGMQQGSQIALVMSQTVGANGLAGGLKLVATGLLSVLTPLSLLVIGSTAVIAALVQWVDWITVAKTGLNFLADILPQVTTAALALGGTLAIAFAPQIISAITATAVAIGSTLVTAIVSATQAMIAFALVNPFAALVLAIAVAGAAAYYFRDDIVQIFGVDIVKIVREVGEFIIDVFIAGYNGTLKAWGNLAPAFDDIMAQTVQNVRKRIENMINTTIDGINTLLDNLPDWMKFGSGQVAKVKFENVPNPNAGAAGKVASGFSDAWSAARATDNIGAIGDAIGGMVDWASSKLRALAASIGQTEAKDKKDKASGAGAAGKTAQTDAEKFLEIIKAANEQLWKLQRDQAAIGMVGEELKKYTHETELLAQARQKNIPLGEKELKIISDTAAELAKQEQINETLKFYEDQKKAIEDNVAALNIENATIGMGAVATGMYRYEQELLNQERRTGIILSDEQKKVLLDTKQTELELAEAIRKRAEQLRFDRDVTRGFFADMMSGVRQGQSAWEAFGNAMNNILDKIIDKLLNEVIDAIFKVKDAASGGGGGGILGALSGLFGGGISASTVSSLTGSASSTIAANPGLFANGGVFTNSVVSRPTAFFAKGGQPGVMGEAGPEAIMPLQRGPDGSLGVKLNGKSAQGGGDQAPITFDMRGAVVTQDLLQQMDRIASDRADVAVIRNNTRNTRLKQRSLSK